MVFYLLLSIAQIMLAVAWATLPDLPTYRTGVIMVGLARQVLRCEFRSETIADST